MYTWRENHFSTRQDITVNITRDSSGKKPLKNAKIPNESANVIINNARHLYHSEPMRKSHHNWNALAGKRKVPK